MYIVYLLPPPPNPKCIPTGDLKFKFNIFFTYTRFIINIVMSIRSNTQLTVSRKLRNNFRNLPRKII